MTLETTKERMAMGQQWEYRVVEMNISERWSAKRQAQEVIKLEGELNESGQEGWEMINYQAVPLTGSFSGNVKGYAYLCFFKRRK